MSYCVGFGGGVLAHAPQEPHLTCDGCGIRASVAKPHGVPYSWFLDGKAKPGWSIKREVNADTGGVQRRDYCGKCKGQVPDGE